MCEGSTFGLDIQHHVESVIVVANLRTEPGKVKTVLDISRINFTEQLVSLKADKPRDPGIVVLGGVRPEFRAHPTRHKSPESDISYDMCAMTDQNPLKYVAYPVSIETQLISGISLAPLGGAGCSLGCLDCIVVGFAVER